MTILQNDTEFGVPEHMKVIKQAKAEYDAWSEAVHLCINAVECPTCGARANEPCRTTSGKKTESHIKRVYAGHSLRLADVSSVYKKLFDAIDAHESGVRARLIADNSGANDAIKEKQGGRA
jgi:hypothetical protein